MKSWEHIRERVDADMLLLDLYVLEAGLDGWEAFLDLVRTGKYPYQLTRRDEVAEFPRDVGDLFVGPHDATWTLQIGVGPLDLRCYFFHEDEIELDLLSSSVSSDAEASLLFGYMADVADAVGRECRLTNENEPEHALVQALPGRVLVAT